MVRASYVATLLALIWRRGVVCGIVAVYPCLPWARRARAWWRGRRGQGDGAPRRYGKGWWVGYWVDRRNRPHVEAKGNSAVGERGAPGGEELAGGGLGACSCNLGPWCVSMLM